MNAKLNHGGYIEDISNYFQFKKTGLSWDDFYDQIGMPSYEEAVRKGTPPGGLFRKLLSWRTTDYFREKGKSPLVLPIDELKTTDSTPVMEEDKGGTTGIKFSSNQKSYISSLKELENIVLTNKKMTDNQVKAKLLKVAETSNITTFLGIPIDDISSFQEIQKTKRQNKDYHCRRFDLVASSGLSDIKISSASPEWKHCSTKKFYDIGLEIKGRAKEFDYQFRMKLQLAPKRALNLKEEEQNLSSIKSLMIALINYLMATMYFKKISDFSVEMLAARYNYAYCMKRLGELDPALLKLLDCEKLIHENQQTANSHVPVICLTNQIEYKTIAFIVYESIGDIYFKRGLFQDSISYFQKAYDIDPNDLEVLLNLLEVYNESQARKEIVRMLNEIIETGKNIPAIRIPLIKSVIESNMTEKDILNLCASILSL